MSSFGDDLIQAMGEGPAILNAAVDPREIRTRAKLAQAQMAPLMRMSLSDYRKWEQGQRHVSGPAATLLPVMERAPAAVQRAWAG